MKRVVLCADDYGQANNISQGIRLLLTAKRLSAVSALVNLPDWMKHAVLLIPFADTIDIGLHFNLTAGKPLSLEFQARYGNSLFSLPQLMVMSLLRKLDQRAILYELRAQISAFMAHTGFLPDFIDGHQHVHQFPGVAEALLQVYRAELPPNTYVRTICAGKRFSFKRNLIAKWGGSRFQLALTEANIPHNSSFSGIYRFSQAKNYREHFQKFLAETTDGGIIMCHPGLIGDDNDPLKKVRQQEYDYLNSEFFIEDCEAAEVIIRRFAKR